MAPPPDPVRDWPGRRTAGPRTTTSGWRGPHCCINCASRSGRTPAGSSRTACGRPGTHPDFFLRKAIGWALREYATTDPEAVRGFVETHQERLSPLSVREAMKQL